MPFSDYKSIAQVQQEFSIAYLEADFIVPLECEPSAFFVEQFQFNLEHLDAFSSEAARCEIVIFPILREAYKQYHEKISLWVQKPIAYDDRLNGTPDYLVSKRSALGKTMLEYPLLVVVEAKRNDFEQGWGQCLAELVAARNLNANSCLPIYGIVTDGKLWEFGKLEDRVITKNIDSFVVANLKLLLGALKFVFSEVSCQLTKITQGDDWNAQKSLSC
jgi:hypothetical protein